MSQESSDLGNGARNRARNLWLGNPFRIWSLWAPLGLAVLFWWFYGLYGFNPTDDGFVLGQSWRLAHGQTPHIDFTSPRPVGSALIHLPEAFVPLGMMGISRLVVALQLLWIAYATVSLVTLGRWRLSSLQQFALLTIAFSLNVGVWPMMPWHTIDGLFIGVTALWLALRRTDSRFLDHAQWVVVWLLAGFAPLTKQGFALVPILVAGVLLTSGPTRAWRYTPLVLVPGVVYSLWVGRALLDQLYSGSFGELLTPVKSVLANIESPAGMLTLIAVAFAFLLVSVAPGRRSLNACGGGGPRFDSSHLDGPSRTPVSQWFMGLLIRPCLHGGGGSDGALMGTGSCATCTPRARLRSFIVMGSSGTWSARRLFSRNLTSVVLGRGELSRAT
jgi:hypothetical protein